ncbi:MAG TPA: hypothetical protein VML96_02640 [Egibacteraceae bacterium]|nr:hypothetical protein [Egibacteraceae bacterium]
MDLESDRVEVYRLHDAPYGRPTLLERGDALGSPQAPGFSIELDDLPGGGGD